MDSPLLEKLRSREAEDLVLQESRDLWTYVLVYQT